MVLLAYVTLGYLTICGILALHMLVHLAIGRRARLLVGPAEPHAMRTTLPPCREVAVAR